MKYPCRTSIVKLLKPKISEELKPRLLEHKRFNKKRKRKSYSVKACNANKSYKNKHESNKKPMLVSKRQRTKLPVCALKLNKRALQQSKQKKLPL